ncbi:MAG: gamma carbonic anhydrase family protein, partial [Corynebacterium sp.]|nr:gamma carbonic anhydrase family protein [Corynebacterium sp.]
MNSPLILPFNGRVPRIHASAYVAPTAVIIGDVEIGADSSVFYGVVIRGDVGSIRIGERTNIQDNSVLHVDTGVSNVLGDDVTVGHQALVHGASVGDGTLIGMSSSLLSGSTVGAGTLIGAGATVLEGQDVPDGVLAA